MTLLERSGGRPRPGPGRRNPVTLLERCGGRLCREGKVVATWNHKVSLLLREIRVKGRPQPRVGTISCRTVQKRKHKVSSRTGAICTCSNWMWAGASSRPGPRNSVTLLERPGGRPGLVPGAGSPVTLLERSGERPAWSRVPRPVTLLERAGGWPCAVTEKLFDAATFQTIHSPAVAGRCR